jgi:serine/threonine protein kinase
LYFHTCFYRSSKLNLLFFSSFSCFHFEIETEQEIFEEVLRGDLDFSSDPWPNVSESAKDLVRKMLVRDPRKRITAHEVLCKLFSFFFFLFSFFFVSVDLYENNHESDAGETPLSADFS